MAHKSMLFGAVLLLMVANLASASFSISQLEAGGVSLFGYRSSDGANLGDGQTFYLPETSRIANVQARFRVPAPSFSAMVLGDPIYANVRDLGGQSLADTMSPLSFANGVDEVDEDGQQYTWMGFNFDAGAPTLSPGNYMVTFHTDVPRQAGICFAFETDPYAAGERMHSSNGGDGPWDTSSLPEGQDLAFKINATPELPPGALVLLGMVPVGVAWWRRRKS